MSSGDRAEPGGVMRAPYVLEYTYRRSTGPTVGAFLTALRDGRAVGGKTARGVVVVPPTEHDPETGEPIVEIVPVATTGVVTTWTWVEEPRPGQPLDRPFAWALVKLDGADTAMLHAVDASGIGAMRTGMRVRMRFRDKRTGTIGDLACFEPDDAGATS